VGALAVAALAGGSTVTEAAKKAGVSRETVSRWARRDPDFIAALQNARAETAAEIRCALEALGGRAVALLREVLERATTPGTKLKVACAVLKMLGADRAEPVAPTTAEEVRLRLREREEELRELRSKIDAGELAAGRPVRVPHAPEAALAATAPAVAPRIEAPADGGAAAAGREPSGAAEAMAWQPADQPLGLPDAERGQHPGGDTPGPLDPLLDPDGPVAEPAREPALELGEGQPGAVADRRLGGAVRASRNGRPGSSMTSSTTPTSPAPARMRRWQPRPARRPTGTSTTTTSRSRPAACRAAAREPPRGAASTTARSAALRCPPADRGPGFLDPRLIGWTARRGMLELGGSPGRERLTKEGTWSYDGPMCQGWTYSPTVLVRSMPLPDRL
jgi:hypothetical protein